MKALAIFVVLLRAIGPATHKVMGMADWRAAAEAEGFRMPETYLATGNMIVEATGTISEVAKRMDDVVGRCGLGAGNKAFVRKPATLRRLVKANPFPDAIAGRPSQVGIHFMSAARPDFKWLDEYEGDEPIHIEGNHVIIDYGDAEGQSLRLAGLIEKRSGAATARNWNTLNGLAQRATERERKSRE